jgi:hypothetical protein
MAWFRYSSDRRLRVIVDRLCACAVGGRLWWTRCDARLGQGRGVECCSFAWVLSGGRVRPRPVKGCSPLVCGIVSKRDDGDWAATRSVQRRRRPAAVSIGRWPLAASGRLGKLGLRGQRSSRHAVVVPTTGWGGDWRPPRRPIRDVRGLRWRRQGCERSSIHIRRGFWSWWSSLGTSPEVLVQGNASTAE